MKTKTNTLRPIVFETSWIPAANQLPWYYAQEKGYFTDAGLNVTIKSGKGSTPTVQQTGAGVVDIAQSDLSVMALAHGKGIPVKAVFVEFPKSVYGIITADSSHIQSFADLRGKTILVTPGDISTFLLPAALKKVGVPMSTVHIRTVAANAKDELYATGKAEAAAGEISDLPYLDRQRASTALPFGDVLNVPYLGLIASDRFLQAHPDEVRAFITATQKGLEAMISNPNAASEVAHYIARTQPDANVALLVSQWKTYKPGDFRTPQQKGHPLGWMPLAMWQQEINILHKYAGLTSKQPPTAYFTNQFLPSK